MIAAESHGQGLPEHTPHISLALGGLVSAAAVSGETNSPRPNLYLAIGNASRDHLGYVAPDEAQRAEIISALAYIEGLMPSEGYGEAEVRAGVDRARHLVDSAKSTEYLSTLAMVVNRYDLPSDIKPISIILNGELSIDPRRVVGVGGLRNWQGVAYDDQHRLITKQEQGDSSGRSRPNCYLIDDYATRDTQLPPASGVDLFLTSEGAFAYSHDSHRVAAAQLRNEPVRINDMQLYDYRTRPMSPQVQQQLANGLKVAELNIAVR